MVTPSPARDSTPAPQPPPPTVAAQTQEAPPPASATYHCGTLQYTKAGLFVLFGWLLWGDLIFQLFESAGGPGILGLYLQDNFHVSNVQVNILFNLIPQMIGVVMTPVISFKSDRTRTRWGRRIPYMVLTAPFLCVFAAAIGFSDEIIDFFKTSAFFSSVSPLTAAMLVIGAMTIGFTFFNEFVATLYWYLFADVVPQKFMGRFMALFRLVGLGAGLLTNAIVVPHQLTHMKAVHVGLALLYFVGFGMMCWRLKEGEYPPVTDVTKKTPFREQVKLYFRECFTHPVYIFFYLMTATTVLTKGLNPSGIFSLHMGQHRGVATTHAAGTNVTAITPDGGMLVSGGADGQLSLWARDGDRLVPRRTLREGGAGVLAVALSADGRMAAAGLADGTVELRDTAEERSLKTLGGHTGPVRGLALDPANRRLATAGSDGTVRVWEARSGDCLLVLTGHVDAVNAVAFSSTGDRVVSAGDDGLIRVWDVATGQCRLTLGSGTGAVYAVAFMPSLEKTSEPQAATTGVLRSARRRVAWYFHYVFTNESLYDQPADAARRIVAADGWIVSGGREGAGDEKNAILRIWNASSGRPVQALSGHKKAITSVVYKPDIRMLLTGSLDGSLRLWDPVAISALAGDQSYKTFSGYTEAVTSLACPASGAVIVNASVDGTLHLWDIDTGISLMKLGLSGTFFAVIGMLLAYPLGALVDRLQAIRVVLWMTLLMLPFPFLRFFFMHDYASHFWISILAMPLGALSGAASMPMQVELMPRTKYGQMSSANALVKQLVSAIAGLLGALLMDRLTRSTMLTDNYRYGYLFSGVAGLLTLAALLGLYRQWKKLGAEDYVAPET